MICDVVLVYVQIVSRSRTLTDQLPWNARLLNIIIIGFDTVSRLAWIRNLPKTYQHLTEQLKAVVLEGYNIVGDGTTQALLPFLTGKTELELPETRRGYSGSRTVDGHQWIWRRLEDIGYVTQVSRYNGDILNNTTIPSRCQCKNKYVFFNSN